MYLPHLSFFGVASVDSLVPSVLFLGYPISAMRTFWLPSGAAAQETRRWKNAALFEGAG
jgi:hypothetical protein